jgi:hypothetical protein
MTQMKASGLGMTTYSVDDAGGTPQAIINDITNWAMAMPRGVQDVTGVDKSAIERLLLLADFSGTMNGPWDSTSSANAHAVFKTIPSTSTQRTMTIVVNGATLANEVLLTDYPLTRTQTGELTWAVPFVLANGVVPAWS